MKKLALLIFFGFVGISLLALLSGRGLVAPWSFIKDISQAKGQYFRAVFEYTYKGESVTLDFINTCGGRLTVYKDNSHSEDIFAGPQLYGLKLPDGKALVADAGYCGYGNRKDSGWPPDLTPVVIVYDDPETLASGYAYVSNEAYERPNSDLKLIKARIMPVTPDEAVALLKVQKPNVVRSLNIQSPWTVTDSEKLNPHHKPAIGVYCNGFFKLPVPTDVVDELRKHWPQDHPRFWVPWDDKEYFELTQIVKNSHLYGGPTMRDGIEVTGRSWTDYMLRGVPARTDGGSAGDNWDVGQGFENNPRRRNLRVAPPFYPLLRLSEDGGEKPMPFYELGDFHYKVETQDDLKKGMLYCVGPGFSRATRPPDDKSPCDIRFGDDPFIMKLRPGMQGNPDAAKGEIISVSPYCAASFGFRDLIYEGDRAIWFSVTETYGSALGAQQDVN